MTSDVGEWVVKPGRIPRTTFNCLIEGARRPQRADRSAGGTIPARAARYCDAITSASSFGWYIFSPLDFTLKWDGHEIFWKWGVHTAWQPLVSAQFPGFSPIFDESASTASKGCSPPFLSVFPEPGLLQIWSGIFARTDPGWSLLVRQPVNLPRQCGYEVFDGIVETDLWFGPLFTNVRLTRTDRPIRIRNDRPLFQVQPLPQSSYDERVMLAGSFISGLTSLTPQDWEDYNASVVLPNDDPDRLQGQYAVKARKRRKTTCPFAAVGRTAEDLMDKI